MTRVGEFERGGWLNNSSNTTYFSISFDCSVSARQGKLTFLSSRIVESILHGASKKLIASCARSTGGASTSTSSIERISFCFVDSTRFTIVSSILVTEHSLPDVLSTFVRVLSSSSSKSWKNVRPLGLNRPVLKQLRVSSNELTLEQCLYHLNNPFFYMVMYILAFWSL